MPAPARRRGLALLASAALLAPVAATLVASPAAASSPASGAVTVSGTVGKTYKDTWTGTIPAGSDMGSSCPKSAPTTTDSHVTTITPPLAGYTKVSAIATFTVTWSAVGPGAVNDEILTVYGPDGSPVGTNDSTNVNNPTETVNVTNPVAGNYTVVACAFNAPTA